MTIGAIDPEQRRVAERLVLAALRKFHREQPLVVDLRMDALVARVRAAAGRKPPPRHRGATALTLEDADLRRVIEEMADDGRLARNGRRVGLAGTRPMLDPEMAEKVDRLLDGLRATGAAPPRVDGLAGRLGIPPTLIDQLRAGGILRQIAPGIDYPADVWSALSARLAGMGGTLTIARVRDDLHTTRRHAEAILAALDVHPAPSQRPSGARRPLGQRRTHRPTTGRRDTRGVG